MKIIPMQDYKNTDEYKNLIIRIQEYLDDKKNNFHIYGYDFYTFKQPSNSEYIMDRYDIPFFDKFTKFYYHKDGKLILNLNIFYWQLNFFMKALFIRIFWAQETKTNDKFAQFIWSEYCNSNDETFDDLKYTALNIFNKCNTIREFYDEFVLNDNYKFIDYPEYRRMMTKTFLEYGYKFLMTNLVEFPQDSVNIFENSQAAKPKQVLRIDNIDIRQFTLINEFDRLHVKSKYNFTPSTKAKALKWFNFSRVFNNGIFFPQLLVFLND